MRRGDDRPYRYRNREPSLSGKRNESLRRLYAPDLKGKTLALSFQTVVELYLWSERAKWGAARRQALDAYLRRFLILPHDADVSRVWARVMSDAQRLGHRFETADAWVAAAAIHYAMPLVTHDKDFTRAPIAGLTVICKAT